MFKCQLHIIALARRTSWSSWASGGFALLGRDKVLSTPRDYYSESLVTNQQVMNE